MAERHEIELTRVAAENMEVALSPEKKAKAEQALAAYVLEHLIGIDETTEMTVRVREEETQYLIDTIIGMLNEYPEEERRQHSDLLILLSYAHDRQRDLRNVSKRVPE